MIRGQGLDVAGDIISADHIEDDIDAGLAMAFGKRLGGFDEVFVAGAHAGAPLAAAALRPIGRERHALDIAAVRHRHDNVFALEVRGDSMIDEGIDTGDFVIVVNAEKVAFSGNKWDQKVYTRYTGYPGLRTETAKSRLERHPDRRIGPDRNQDQPVGNGLPSPGI